MSSQNNMALEGSSLQNHIVRLCFIFITQNTPIKNNPGFSQAIGFILFNALQVFLTLMQYMSVSHGYSTMGGIEYHDGGCVEKTKKLRKSHIDEANQWAMEMPIN